MIRGKGALAIGVVSLVSCQRPAPPGKKAVPLMRLVSGTTPRGYSLTSAKAANNCSTGCVIPLSLSQA